MNKKFKFIIASFIACFLLFSLSSCGNKNKYLDGEVCGEATAEGTNAFSQIRRFYVEQFVYDYNLAKVAEGQPYAEFKEVYDDKFIYDVDTTTLTKVEAGQDNYSQAHYIFTYYERNTAGNLLTSATVVRPLRMTFSFKTLSVALITSESLPTPDGSIIILSGL